jgi:Raf kinase inhibitor-like YbhB/YbcL family protein
VPRRRLLPLLLALALATAVIACSESDGRTLPPPGPAQTTTTPSTPVIQTPLADFTLVSPSFLAGQVLPTEFTCTGAGTSPDLTWTGTPADTAELALVVRDRAANGFLHWVVSGIDPSLSGFGRDGVPEGAVEATNGVGTVGWTPPCPPADSGAHSYEFTVHALPGSLALEPGTDGATAADLIEQASTAQANLIVTYPAG